MQGAVNDPKPTHDGDAPQSPMMMDVPPKLKLDGVHRETELADK